ncbi:DNA excision repair protein ERCC-6-like isoform X2 [Amblyomma americanum]
MEHDPCVGSSSRSKVSPAADEPAVECGMDQADELRSLGVHTACNQADLEQGVLEEMDRIVQQKEAQEQRRAIEKEVLAVRRSITVARRRLEQLEKSVCFDQLAASRYVPSEIFTRRRHDKVEELRKLEAEEKRLLALLAAPQQIDSEPGSGWQATLGSGFFQQETEEEMLIRTGQMTPFGTVAKEPGAVPCRPPLEEAAVLSPPRKRRREQLPSGDPLVDEPEEEGDGGRDGGESDDEYRPEGESPDSEDDDLPASEKEGKWRGGSRRPGKSTRGTHASSSSLSPSSRKKLARKLTDDGNYAAYLRRLKEHRRLRLLEKHRRIVESDGSDDGSEESAIDIDDEFRVPKEIWNKLYRYQQTGVRWLWELHRLNCGGIVGDEMGLGKTVQTIAFLAGLRHSRLHSPGDSFTGLGPVLLVCPATVMHQWVREFHRWCPPLRVAILHESGSYAGNKESLVKQMIRANGVLVTSYACVAKLSGPLHKHDWHYVILDEGHKIRNPDAQTTLACKQFRTTHRLILSGSPIQNSLRELWSLLDFVFPGKLGTLPVFMQEFAVPITQGGYANASEVQVQTAYRCASALRDIIRPYLLRRMKEDVRSHLQLPAKSEQVLFCRLTDHQREVYRQYLDSPDVASILVGRLQVFVGLIQLRKICNHPDLYDGGPKILGNVDTSTLPPEMRYGFPGRSGKMAVVEGLLKLWKKQNHRVLLFTQSRQMLVILERFVQEQGYSYMVMTGSTPIGSRQPAINKFNADPSVFVFLLTTRVGGLGVNLTGADRVVIYDPDWNPSTDSQARERAWRIGQRRDVTIYRLLTAGTIEEKIYHRQIFKQFLTNRVLKDPKQRRFFKTNDLHELFTLADDGKKTETSAIFAGTGSNVKVKKRERRSSSRADADAEASNGETSAGHVVGSPEKIVGSSADPPRQGPGVRVQKEPQGAAVELAPGCGSTSKEAGRLLSDEKIQQMRELARQLSQKISQGSSPSVKHVEKPVGTKKDAKHGGRRHKSRSTVVEGECIGYVVKQATYQPGGKDEATPPEQSQKQDDYVLQKLFKKSGVHSAMRHDRILDSAEADYSLVEGEAERVAREAIRRLRESRRQCLSARSGVPTWTGTHGASGAPPGTRPRFGQKKASRPSQQAGLPSSRPAPKSIKKSSGALFKDPNPFTQEAVPSSSGPVSSSELLACIRARKPPSSTAEEALESSELPSGFLDTGQGELDELLADLQTFVAFGASVDGQATTGEVLAAFKNKVHTGGKVPVFKALLSKICEFYRHEDGQGVWKLRPEFR